MVNYLRRTSVERGFSDTKQWRGLATRYDKLALTYRGGAVLRAITLGQVPGSGVTADPSL